MKNLKLTIEYEGANYHGWQFQPNSPTIQGIIQEKILTITGEKVKLIGAGRTDAGVHAAGQIANFRLKKDIPLSNLWKGLNSLLPRDIRITDIQQVEDDFHARYHAKSKEYKYQIFTGMILSPFLYRYVYHLPLKLGLEEMFAAAELFIGKHNFAPFSPAVRGKKNAIREVFSSSFIQQKEMLNYRIRANGFLHYMVRNIVGSLIEIGKGKLTKESLVGLLDNPQRSGLVAPTAPPQGLFLMKIEY